MRFRLLMIAVLLSLGTSGVALLTVEPLFESVFRVIREFPGGQSFNPWSVRRALVTLGLLNLGLATSIIYFYLRAVFGQPLARAERAVSARLVELGLPSRVQGVEGLVSAADRLSEALGTERATANRRLDELSRSMERQSRLQTELVAADRLATVGKLAAGVAHEVGNPLSGILGYLSVLRMKAEPAGPTAEVVDRIEAEVRRIDGIVRGLLEMGRPSRGKAQPIDVRPLIDGCVKMVGSMRENVGVVVEVDCPESAWVRAEPGPLSQVLVNLLLNGCQAMTGRGRLTVKVELREGQGLIRVEDEGPGLPAEVVSRLFTPFFTTKPPGQGTGLGLAVSRHLLSQFDGRLDAGNRPEGGARFTITLPAP